jgi:hypothetical protein
MQIPFTPLFAKKSKTMKRARFKTKKNAIVHEHLTMVHHLLDTGRL